MRENPFQKIYRSKKYTDVLLHIDKPLKFPMIVDVESTNFCNLKCLFCGQRNMTRPRGYMSEETFKKIVDECAEHNTPIRIIGWGESFLHPKIIDFLRYAKSKVPFVHITTNGHLIKEKQMQDLIEMELDSMIFSFQGATKERYEYMRNNKNYDGLKANIIKMVELRGDKNPFIQISCTMTDETQKEIDAFKKYWGSIVDFVGIGKTNLSKIPLPEDIREHETIEKVYCPCTEVWHKMTVNWDGKVSACCSDWDNFMVIGDMNKNTLKDIWDNSEDLKRFRGLLGNMKHKSLTLCSTCYHTYSSF